MILNHPGKPLNNVKVPAFKSKQINQCPNMGSGGEQKRKDRRHTCSCTMLIS